MTTIHEALKAGLQIVRTNWIRGIQDDGSGNHCALGILSLTAGSSLFNDLTDDCCKALLAVEPPKLVDVILCTDPHWHSYLHGRNHMRDYDHYSFSVPGRVIRLNNMAESHQEVIAWWERAVEYTRPVYVSDINVVEEQGVLVA